MVVVAMLADDAMDGLNLLGFLTNAIDSSRSLP